MNKNKKAKKTKTADSVADTSSAKPANENKPKNTSSQSLAKAWNL